MDIKAGKLAAKYAQAFFNVYGQQLAIADFWQIKSVVTFLAQHSKILSYFNDHQASEQAKINQIFITYFSLPKNIEALLKLLQKQKRMVLLPAILTLVLELYQIKHRQIFFKITSYPALSAAQIEQIKNYLEHETGLAVLYDTQVNQNVIAGFRAQSMQLIYDQTIQCRLQKFYRKLNKAGLAYAN